eukprot:TRINITY_DN11052_c0_g2_i1.p1 TRINITY_DN11052_c0_g2~~TRINITY_DN11052_c0_g2_i1.p1  ORF type:complete len:201 (+),score=29.57 TRINITY_DN11052_c0_g2_i1:55-657(+)
MSSPELLELSLDSDMSVEVKSEQFRFQGAHFAASRGLRERLHGHNYTASIRIAGRYDLRKWYLVDFGLVKSAVKHVCGQLHERFFVPMLSDVIRISVDRAAGTLKMACDDGARFAIPLSDCVLLPIAQSSCEEIVAYFHGAVAMELEARAAAAGEQLAGLVMEVRIFDHPSHFEACTRTVAESAAAARKQSAETTHRSSL